jgi:indole-3-glycerol phosphate synthase/phosphoribosylanthranilate isomerase
MEEILKKIVSSRLETIQKKGINFGMDIPSKRVVPLTLPDPDRGTIICEIKRGSPSEGRMNGIPDPVGWAKRYVESGADAISVLTEENFFFGSLGDLMNVKKNLPGIPVLRKDFLTEEGEIDVSYNAGADMVLLITSILDHDRMKKMKERAEALGMLPLIEVHDAAELESVLPLKPRLVGINSRNLKTFTIDRNYPFALIDMIRKDNRNNGYRTDVIFESGIRNHADAFFAGSSDFSGILAGTSIIKCGDPQSKINELKDGFVKGAGAKNGFFTSVFGKIHFGKKPVVKICGITDADDADNAVKYGADILGFIFAESPRKIRADAVRVISEHVGKKSLKVGVVGDADINEAVLLAKEGFLDAIQFHGELSNEECVGYGVNWYKAVRTKDKSDFEKKYSSPFVLYDAFSKTALGGTGKLIDGELLEFAKSHNVPLFLAGGITPDNVGDIIRTYNPMMIDISSGVESSPGKKDEGKIKKLFEEIDRSRI